MTIARITSLSLIAICLLVTGSQTDGDQGSQDIVYTGPRIVQAGSKFTITCRVSHYMNVNWRKDGYGIYSNQSSHLHFRTERDISNVTYQVERLIVESATPEYSGQYSCSKDATEFHSLSVIVEITTNEEQPGSGIVFVRGQPATLQCNMSSDPSLNFAWSKNGVPIDGNTPNIRIYHENHTLVIDKATDADGGAYNCALETDKAKNNTIWLRSVVKAELKKAFSFVEGDRVKIACKIEGSPTPIISWSKDGVLTTDLNDTRIKLQPDDKNVSNSVLEIEMATYEDRGIYSCIVANDISNATAQTNVRIKDKLAALWPFLGIVAEVIILCAIIFIYERRRAKQEFEESDTDQSPESKPVADHKDKEVRQRK